jgi:hypothetical protein
VGRIPASEPTREQLKRWIKGQGARTNARSELVRLAAWRIVEEAWEGKMAEFERYQLKAIENDLDGEIAQRTRPAASAAVTAPQTA